MRFIWLTTQSPYFNLAAEAYLLQHTDEEIFMLWQNANAIIVGRHQNTLAEINQPFVERNNITVARRLTGGGAVFHDLGNLNFTFIQNIPSSEQEVDFVRFLNPIVEALQSLGVPATFSGRNDLVIHGKKISGNAMVFYKNRVLEHGTLLFSTIQNNLAEALNVDAAKFEDKAVKSVRSRVTNISEHLRQAMTVTEFKDYLMDFVLRRHNLEAVGTLREDEVRAIQELADRQFSTWEWNYGKSPKYAINRKLRTRGGIVQAAVDVRGGRIADVQFYGDFFNRTDPRELARQLTGAPHEHSAIRQLLQEANVSQYFNGATTEEILSLLC